MAKKVAKKAVKKTTVKKVTAKKIVTKAVKKIATKRKPNAKFMAPMAVSASLAEVVGAKPIPRVSA